VVVDYRQGATPRVHYARRAVCSACHHAAAPIFSRPGWDETNANPVVARALSRHAERFHGVAVKRGIDVPNAIDDAVARANRLALAQTLWQQGCDAVKPPADAVACRQALLTAVLERKLPAAGLRASDPGMKALAPLLAAWKSRWPRGLFEADPNIPNRDPFFGQAQQLTAEQVPPWGAEEVTPALDPMMPREPIRNWRPDPMGVQLLLHTLAGFFAASDLQAVERALGQDGRESRLARATGAIAAGTRVGRTDAFASAPFRRAAVLRALAAELQMPLASTCCDAPAPAFDAPRVEGGTARTPRSIPQPLAAFYRHSAACHAAAAESPPGFLQGNNLEAVERQLARCAPRIAFRLSMWARPAGERPKVPMPPPVFVPGWEQAAPRADIEHMLDYVRRAGAGQALDVLRGRGYESLPPCRESKPGASAAAVR
jgi:hypothetical protein